MGDGWFHYLRCSVINLTVAVNVSFPLTLPPLSCDSSHLIFPLPLNLGAGEEQRPRGLRGCHSSEAEKKGLSADRVTARGGLEQWQPQCKGRAVKGPWGNLQSWFAQKASQRRWGESWMSDRKEAAIKFSARGVWKNLIPDEMCSCLCTINFPPK